MSTVLRPLGGWRPDPEHDLLPVHPVHLSAVAPALPPSTNNRAASVPIQDQGQLGSCTAFAWIRNVWHVLMREGKDPGRPSEMLQYQLELMLQNRFGQDVGATISLAVRAFQQSGFALGTEYPYVMSSFRYHPSQTVLLEAAARRLPNLSVYRVHQDLTAMKAILFAGKLICFGSPVTNSFMSQQTASTGVWSGPGANDPVAGGHAINLVDYDDAAFGGKGGFYVANSWGTGWGQKGYVLVPYSWILGPGPSDFASAIMA